MNVTQLDIMARQAVRKKETGAGYNRRANGEGTVFQRKGGDWVAEVDTGSFKVTGKPIKKRFTGKTQEAVKAKAAEYRRLRDSGQLVDYSTQTLAEYAAGFLDRYCAGKAANTQRDYRNEMKPFLASLGGMKLQRIRPKDIQAALEAMQSAGYQRKPGGKAWPYSARSLTRSLVILRALFEEAVRLELVRSNPAKAARAPKVDSPQDDDDGQGRALEADELAALNPEFENLPTMGLLFRLLLTTGLRKGEALALTWGDIDLERPAQLRVYRSWQGRRIGFTPPKTKGSKRKVPIPESMAQVLRVLKAATMAKVGKDISGLHLFGNPATNLPYDPTSVWHALNRICGKLGLRKMRVHDLRHTYGSHLLAQGVDIAVVSRYMGHSNINITLGIYRSVLNFELGEVPSVLDVALERARKTQEPVALPN